MNRQRVLRTAAWTAAFVAVATVGWRLGGLALGAQPVRMDVGVTYEDLTFEQMAASAEVVVAGEVVAISPTRWNQDSGEFWETTFVDRYGRQVADTALPYYEVTVVAERTLADDLGLGAAPGTPVVFTVIGHSPMGTPGDSGVLVNFEHADGAIGLTVGSPAVVFARRTDMAWRAGSKAILQPLGDPNAAFVAVGRGQLDTLADQLDALRGPAE